MNQQEAIIEALEATRNQALSQAWNSAAQYRAEATIQKERADNLQAELDKIKAKSVPNVKAAKT